ncbi:RNA pyrophosphohydrolase [Robiginitomaculum antarcticum]|uniref:RNA pyrophosphohydrolase n=1 Tax=Robiginitomaculum antarcticum TaxID=437507 RepID=UPI00035DFAD6|nr:RNA pyrophosphohydrolase [Robiginitomaculum antarcticum]
MTLPTGEDDAYRPAAGVCLFNGDGKVWLGRRANTPAPYCWQFPQGGIDAGEDPLYAAIREVHEETGAHVNLLSPLAQVQDWLYYDIPGGHRRKERLWHGQKQRWFAFRYHGGEDDFNLKYHMPAEFTQWRWASLSEACDLIVPFKRDLYARLAQDFAHLENV